MMVLHVFLLNPTSEAYFKLILSLFVIKSDLVLMKVWDDPSRGDVSPRPHCMH